jgi:signal transduction histidine kinase
MAMLGQSSFRRILLSRILLLTIPILLLGVGVTFRKARTSLLYTARQNLVESAIGKSEEIRSSIKNLETSLAIAGETTVLQAGSSAAAEGFLKQLVPQLPSEVRCLQLTNAKDQLVASTCGDRRVTTLSSNHWAPRQVLGQNPLQTHLLVMGTPTQSAQSIMPSQLNLTLSTPVYSKNGQLRFTLSALSTITQRESGDPWSLLGYTVVVDQQGTILAHPFPQRVGRNVKQEGDADRYADMMANVRHGQHNFSHLFGFGGDGAEWLAGFSPLEVPITATDQETWLVLAVTRLDNALEGLKEITQILLILTAGLVAAHLLAMLYVARDLARPLEQLGKYARRIHKRDPLERAPKNFRIKEVNQLAEVLDNMVRRLEERAKELEDAWQEAEAANKLKSEFLANTSHELRTPLNAIIGCVRLVQDGCCDTREEEMEFLDQADKAAIHLLKIINDLLDIAKIEGGEIPLSLELVDIRPAVQEVISLQTVQIHQKGLQLTTPEFSEPLMVRADPARLKQVLLNVIFNAVKFTDQGGISVSTRIERAIAEPNSGKAIEPVSSAIDSSASLSQNRFANADPAKGVEAWVVVAVKDTGIGIDPNQQHKLFRPFVMVDGSTTRKYEGTGLGLAISRNLIELMGGSITLQSAGVGQGTTVEIIMPLITAAHLLPAIDSVESKPVEAKTSQVGR